MAGKYRDFDGQFMMVEINFLLDDPDFHDLTDTQKVIFLKIWGLAVRRRRDTLNFRTPIADLAHICRKDTRVVEKATVALQEKHLIHYDGESTITVYGVRDKHPNLKWKDNGKSENLDPQKRPQKEKEKKKEEKKEKEKKLTPPAAAIGKPPTEFQEKQRAIIDQYGRSFGSECSWGVAGKILNLSGDFGDAIVAIIECEDFVKNGGLPMSGIRKKLRDRRDGLWSAKLQADSTAYNTKFSGQMTKKYGQTVGDVLGRIAGKSEKKTKEA